MVSFSNFRSVSIYITHLKSANRVHIQKLLEESNSLFGGFDGLNQKKKPENMWSQSFRLQATSPKKKTAAEKVPMHPKSVEETLAEDIAEEVRRHGGQLQANHLPSLRPDVRKRLGDEKLLHFLGRFSDLVQIQEKHGGHVLLAEAPRVECSNVIGNAKAAATCPGPSIPERAVHALRQLEREVLRCVHDTSRSVDIAYLLHNGKLRRKIGAVVRFLPLADLMIQETDGESLEPARGCPRSAHARTFAGYLLQFLRDRPEKFQVERGGRTLA